MRMLGILLVSAVATAAAAQTQNTTSAAPKTIVDRNGRVILVVKPDGGRCMYNYGTDGRLMSPIDPSCGAPEVWLTPKPTG